jgi:hypothetical protein
MVIPFQKISYDKLTDLKFDINMKETKKRMPHRGHSVVRNKRGI